MHNSPRTNDNFGFLTVIDHPRHGLIGGYIVLTSSGRPLEFSCTTPVKPNRTQEILYGETLEPFLFGEQIAQTLLARSKTEATFVLTDAEPVLAAQEYVEQPIIFVFGNPPKRTEKKIEAKPETPLLTVDNSSTVTATESQAVGSVGQENLTDFQSDIAQIVQAGEISEERPTPIEISEELNESLKAFGITQQHPLKQRDDDKQFRLTPIPGVNIDRWKEVKIGQRTVAVPYETAEERDHFVEELKHVSRAIDLAEPFTRLRLAIEEVQRAG